MMVTIGGENGLINNPVTPAACRIMDNVLGVMPMEATSGMIMGAITALPPVSVLSIKTMVKEVIIDASIALSIVFTPIFRIIICTIFSATPVSFRMTPSPEPSMMIKPTSPKKEPSELLITLPNSKRLVLVIMPPITTHIATFTKAWILGLKARII